jgi:two-component system, OmpR family, response regulator RegX3
MSREDRPYRILVVDDEPMLLDSLTVSLEDQGYQVRTAMDGPSALHQAGEQRPDLVLLDLMLPGLDGMQVCRELRARTRIPIIMLTAREEIGDKVQGLELGADDYVTKPFVLRELLARVRAVLRRAHEDDQPLPERWRLGELEVDETRREVVREGQRVELSPKEFALLRVLARRPGTVLSRAHLIEQVWGDEFMGDEKTLDVHIRWLREKIERDPSRPALILTIRGAGYKFVEEGQNAAGDRRETAG